MGVGGPQVDNCQMLSGRIIKQKYMIKSGKIVLCCSFISGGFGREKFENKIQFAGQHLTMHCVPIKTDC